MVKEKRLGNWLQRKWNRKEIAVLKEDILYCEEVISRNFKYVDDTSRVLDSARALYKDIEDEIKYLERFTRDIREIISLERSLFSLNESIVDNEKYVSSARGRLIEAGFNNNELRMDVKTLEKYS